MPSAAVRIYRLSEAIGPELLRGPHAVAVGTTDNALIDLAIDRRLGLAGDHRPDAPELLRWVDMIEIQNHRVSFTAINTGVGREIGNQQIAVREALTNPRDDVPPQVAVAILAIVLLAIVAPAGSAVVGTRSASLVLDRECLERLFRVAAGTDANGLEHRDTCEARVGPSSAVETSIARLF